MGPNSFQKAVVQHSKDQDLPPETNTIIATDILKESNTLMRLVMMNDSGMTLTLPSVTSNTGYTLPSIDDKEMFKNKVTNIMHHMALLCDKYDMELGTLMNEHLKKL